MTHMRVPALRISENPLSHIGILLVVFVLAGTAHAAGSAMP